MPTLFEWLPRCNYFHSARSTPSGMQIPMLKAFWPLFPKSFGCCSLIKSLFTLSFSACSTILNAIALLLSILSSNMLFSPHALICFMLNWHEERSCPSYHEWVVRQSSAARRLTFHSAAATTRAEAWKYNSDKNNINHIEKWKSHMKMWRMRLEQLIPIFIDSDRKISIGNWWAWQGQW